MKWVTIYATYTMATYCFHVVHTHPYTVLREYKY